MPIRNIATPEEFEAVCGDALRRDVAVNQMPLGIAEAARVDPGRYANGIRMMAVLDAGGACVGAAVQTPPYGVLISGADEDVACELADAVAREWRDVTQVYGTTRAAYAFARRFKGPEPEVIENAGLYVLTEVAPCAACEGRARIAVMADAELLQRWMEEFNAEAMPRDPALPPGWGERLAGSGRCWVWEREGAGEVVCFANNGRRIAGYWSVGPVYTPRGHRGRGYATSLVTHLSAYALANGASACTLFTDLANPTSNAIYERIGYRRVGSFARLGIA